MFSDATQGFNDDEEEQQLRPADMINLWKNLQDLLRNQFKEECQVVRDKNKKLQQQRTKFYKVTLKRDDLDKFHPGKKFDDFQVVLLLNKKYIDQKAPGPTPGK